MPAAENLPLWAQYVAAFSPLVAVVAALGIAIWDHRQAEKRRKRDRDEFEADTQSRHEAELLLRLAEAVETQTSSKEKQGGRIRALLLAIPDARTRMLHLWEMHLGNEEESIEAAREKFDSLPFWQKGRLELSETLRDTSAQQAARHP